MKYFETESGILYNENCLDTMSRMQDNYIDMAVTSPPYDNLRDYKGYEFDYKSVIKELYRVTKIGGVVVWVVGDATVNGSETGTSFKQALFAMDCGFNLHDTMIWNKGGFSAVGALKTRYSPVFEYMFIFVKGKIATFNPIKDRKNKCAGMTGRGTIRQKDGSTKPMSKKITINDYGQRFNVWNIFPKNQRGNCHPAPFPEKLANDHIISWSNEGDLVYDCFSGSGTTWKMAEKLNRKFIGSEISADYCEIAKQRILSLDKYNYVSELF